MSIFKERRISIISNDQWWKHLVKTPCHIASLLDGSEKKNTTIYNRPRAQTPQSYHGGALIQLAPVFLRFALMLLAANKMATFFYCLIGLLSLLIDCGKLSWRGLALQLSILLFNSCFISINGFLVFKNLFIFIVLQIVLKILLLKIVILN